MTINFSISLSSSYMVIYLLYQLCTSLYFFRDRDIGSDLYLWLYFSYFTEKLYSYIINLHSVGFSR